ncbi:hypothetical protein L9F63_004319, partial [Diploptera punctata]
IVASSSFQNFISVVVRDFKSSYLKVQASLSYMSLSCQQFICFLPGVSAITPIYPLRFIIPPPP